MSHTVSALHAARRFAAGLALCLAACHVTGPVLATETITLETVPLQIADHGGGGGLGSSGILGSTAAAPMVSTLQSGVTFRYVNNSLFGNWLLAMAYERDAELHKLARHLGFTNTLTLLSVAGVTGLGLAQSIYSYRQIEPVTAHVHEENGEGHIHLDAESRTPAIMGIVGSGVTLAALGTRAVINARYKRKITARQTAISRQIDGIIQRLAEKSASLKTIQSELATLVGEQASNEFLALWQMVHHCPAMESQDSPDEKALPELPE